MSEPAVTAFKVYQAIAAVMAEVAKEGISKDRKNQQQGYQFRGIDDVYNALSPVLARHSLCILPRVLNRTMVERQTQKGGTLFYTTVEVEFDFVSAEDGSRHTIKTFGEAMDSADKSTNKAMSAAYKYACMQAFCIPTEGDNDADASTPDVAPRQARGSEHQDRKPAEGTPFDGEGQSQAAQDRDEIARLIGEARSMDELKQLWNTPWIRSFMSSAPAEFAKPLEQAMGARKRTLTGQTDQTREAA